MPYKTIAAVVTVLAYTGGAFNVLGLVVFLSLIYFKTLCLLADMAGLYWLRCKSKREHEFLTRCAIRRQAQR